MKAFALALVTFFLIGSGTSAALSRSTFFADGLSAEDAKIDLARVQQQVTLLEETKDASELRVSLVVIDQGGSTDVSPKASLLLTTFNESEMASAGSTHLLSSTLMDLISAKTLKPGLFEVEVELLDFMSDCTPTDKGTIKKKLTIKARGLIEAVMRLDLVEEFDHGHFTEPIAITAECQ